MNGITRHARILILSLIAGTAMILTSCASKEYNGFKVVRQNGEQCVSFPSENSSASLTLPLTYYQVSEVYLESFAEMYNRFTLEAKNVVAWYEESAEDYTTFNSALIPEEYRASFEKWVSLRSPETTARTEAFMKSYRQSYAALAGVLYELGRQDPLFNQDFSTQAIFDEYATTPDVKAALAFFSTYYPTVKIISSLQEQTPFILNSENFTDLPVTVELNEIRDFSIIEGELESIKIPVSLYKKLSSIAQTIAENYNSFSVTDRQLTDSLFEESRKMNDFFFTVNDFFTTPDEIAVFVDWMRYIASIEQEDAAFLRTSLKNFGRAQWEYSYELISVLDALNWYADYTGSKEKAAQTVWNDYVQDSKMLTEAIQFYEKTFPGLTFITSLDDRK